MDPLAPTPEIAALLVQLNDALCQFERGTGIGSVLILRDRRGWEHRSVDGKPASDDLMDEELFGTLR